MDLRSTLRDKRQQLLLELAIAGNQRAFRLLYRELFDLVAGYLSARVRPREDAEDLTAVVFHKFLVALRRYDASKGSVRTWVMTLTRNVMLDHFRCMRANSPLEEEAMQVTDPERDPLDCLIDREAGELLHGLMSDYPLEVREMFAMHFGQGLRYHEIAKVLGISEVAVRKRFSRNLQKLRSEFEGRPRRRRRGSCVLEN